MTYRERPVTCPRCQVPLERHGDAGERWRCTQCRGAAISAKELVAALHALAPDLVPAAHAALASATARPVPTPLECPSCGQAMAPLVVGPVELDRCLADEMLWFDDWEHVTVLAAASDRDQRPWLQELLGDIMPPPQEPPAVEPAAEPAAEAASVTPTDPPKFE